MDSKITQAMQRLQAVRPEDCSSDEEVLRGVVEAVDCFIDAFDKAPDTQARLRLAQVVEYSYSFAFLLYASNASVTSVREGRPEIIRRGLIALAVENCTFDARDSLLALTKLYHSARILQAEDLFEQAAAVSCDPFRGVILQFMKRSEDERCLAAFGLRETAPPAPFGYELVKLTHQQSSSRVKAVWSVLRRLFRNP